MEKNLIGESTDGNVAAVKGENTGSGGFGVLGICATGHGVHGQSITSKGVVGESEGFHGVFGKSRDNVGVAAESQNTEAMNAQNHSANHAAIIAINHANGVGVQGRSGGNVGVLGESDTGRGIMGTSNTHIGVSGDSQLGQGVRGTSVRGRGTEGWSTNLEGVFGSSKESTGVLGVAEGSGTGVIGQSNTGIGVHGRTKNKSAVLGTSENGQGLTAFSDNDVGIFSQGATFAGVFNGAFVVNKGPNPKDPSKPPSDINGSIVINDGNLFVNKGDVIVTGADCAEDFDIIGVESVESGTVMVINEEGALRVSDQPYDKKVAGVVSGAGDYKPGLVLDRQQSQGDRKPIALLGKVYCKVDAQHGAIEVGDLLTTSPTSGHAMKATDPLKAFGAVIGKALRPLKEGQGLIPILVTLQ